MLQIVFTVLVVILGSAICSGTETAILSVPVLRVRQLAQSGQKSAIALLKIRENINRPIATIVILNNIFNLLAVLSLAKER